MPLQPLTGQVTQEYLFGPNNPQQSAWPWLTQSVITQTYGQAGEEGVDLGLDVGTPITSLIDGTVVSVGYYKGGGVVSVEGLIKGQTAALYTQHLDLINGPIDAGFGVRGPIRVGAKVKQLDVLGWSGGQLHGGHHPSAGPPYSTGPHIEVGYNAPYGGLWNPHHLTPSENPIVWLRAIALEGPGGTAVGTQVQKAIAAASTIGPSFLPLAQALDDAEWFPGWHVHPTGITDIPGTTGQAIIKNFRPFSVRLLIVVIGLFLLILGIWQVIRPAVQTVEREAIRALPVATAALQADQAAQNRMPRAAFDTTGLVPQQQAPANDFAAQLAGAQRGRQRLNTGMLRGTPAENVGAGA